MTIRAAILRAFLGLVIGTILISGALSFFEFRRSLQAEIARNLRLSAEALAGRMDAFFIERRKDVEEWHRLEILEDIRVGDVDKRLARLLSDLKAGHGGVYRRLYCTDLAGRVVAASDGAAVDTPGPSGPPVNLGGDDGGTTVVLAPTTDSGSAQRIVLRSEIPSGLGGGTLGYLYAEVEWAEIERFLGESVAGTGRTALLLSNARRAIAAAGPLAEAALSDAANLAAWRLGQGDVQPEVRDGAPLGAGPLLLGEAATAEHPHLLGFDWRLILVEPTGIAFAAIWRLAWAILGVLLLTLALAAWFAVRLSARIARPIGELTTFARALNLSRTPSPPQVESGLAEVGELNRAFGEMLQALGRSREHLIRAGKLAVVGEMSAIMAHEVRTPLGILKSSAQLLERRAALGQADRELISYIGSETERLNRLVTTLLECASPRPPAFQPHDLHAILDHVVSLLAGKSGKQGVALDVQAGSADPVVACDREQMVQVLLNLLINAIQLVPEGGHIRVGTADAAGAILVWVEDDGPGIPEADRERIFDPFFTRRDGGVGLGLTIVRQIVESHRGEIAVSQGPSGGACFTIRLPRAKGGASP